MSLVFDAANVRVVIFDLDDTLRANHPHAHNFLHDFVASQGLALEPDALHKSFRWAHEYWATSESMMADLQQHGGMEDPFWQVYSRRHLAALGLDDAQVDELAPRVHRHMREDYQPESRLAPDALEVLDSLRAAGYQAGLLTNRSKPIYQEIHELQLDLHLDFFLTAGQVGAFKPYKQTFERVLDLIQFAPEEVVYVGDSYYADVLGAQNAGIQAVLLDPLGLYPDADCPRIQSLSGVFSLLEIEALV
jgi:putative hydrolase of the HAD superfamily